MKTAATAFKLLVFMVVTATAGFGVVAVAGNLRFGPTNTYSAVFENASGLSGGSEVRVAGVPMGKVHSVELTGDGHALVSFDLSTQRPLTTSTRAGIKYKNLIGDRYLDLSEGSGDPTPLPGNRQIPIAQTAPALDLDQVVNGFRPLLQGLDPDQTNRLARSLVQALNGQESGIAQIVEQMGTLANSLADHDHAIGGVIDNFNIVLTTVHARSDQFGQLVTSLEELVRGLNTDSGTITSSLDSMDGLTAQLGDILNGSRKDIGADVAGLGQLASNLNASTDTLNLVLAKLPETYRLAGRLAGYGNFVNFFVCGLAIRYGPGPQNTTPMFTAPADRCK
ncbi:MAG: Mce family protein [Nocardia sp.]|uniref:MCE family protein n=1 Tax=Nocardia sp. TaxID=1821 RepID=UPI00262347C7|nr:MCE family protein [Nocardia sp.]MCU1643023.1 Mce family protein [Nocardia sp.]